MTNKIKGIKIKEIRQGTGKTAEKDSRVLTELRFFLNRGDEVFHKEDNRFVFYLTDREVIAGLRYGIVGMNVGGERELRISPHLAYGEQGLGDTIPSNALLIAHVKLLDIVEDNFRLPTPFDRYRQVVVSGGGDIAECYPRWSFGIVNDGDYRLTVYFPSNDNNWRYPSSLDIDGSLPVKTMDKLFSDIKQFSQTTEHHVIDVYSCFKEAHSGASRECHSDKRCAWVSISEGEKMIESFFVLNENPTFLATGIMQLIYRLIAEMTETEIKNQENQIEIQSADRFSKIDFLQTLIEKL